MITGYAYDSLPNTRDLRGIACADGRKVKPNMLVRSGVAAACSDHDRDVLLNDVGVRYIVDFRSVKEQGEVPYDAARFPGVDIVSAPALASTSGGITHDAGADEEAARTMRELMLEPGQLLMRLYPVMVLDEPGVTAYTRFFQVLAGDHEGAVLWHCSLGKDRAGLAAALALYALGADWQTIVEDYLATNYYIVANDAPWGGPDLPLEAKRAFNEARQSYFDSAFDAIRGRFGSVDAYLDEALGVSDGVRAALQDRYLEA